jgi:hypothetical protein
MKRFLKGEFDNVAERLKALDDARGFEWPEPRKLSLQEASFVLERFRAGRERWLRRQRRAKHG